MVMPEPRTVHAEPAAGDARPAFPQVRTAPPHSWGINCAQTATIPTNSTIDASAAASSTKVFNISPLPPLEHRENNVPFLFRRQEASALRTLPKLNERLPASPQPATPPG